ncbi:MAG TPA: thermonuclease family protein [Candidatus Dietzia merdigallinarum]|nr:thermonuclease family protein [Candidatus Dietzia merdigallinarum]
MRAIGALIGLGAAAALIGAGGYSLSADEDPTPAAAGSELCDLGSCEHGAVDRVIDGDTVDVVMRGDTRRVRVLGIDTPETNKPGEAVECFGPEATARAEALLPPGSPVAVVADDQADTIDNYGRDLRHLITIGNDENLAQVLVSEGYAETTTFPHSLADQYGATEDDARDHGHGLWGACP